MNDTQDSKYTNNTASVSSRKGNSVSSLENVNSASDSNAMV